MSGDGAEPLSKPLLPRRRRPATPKPQAMLDTLAWWIGRLTDDAGDWTPGELGQLHALGAELSRAAMCALTASLNRPAGDPERL